MSFSRMASDRLSKSALTSDSVEAIASSISGTATRPPPASVAAAPTDMIYRRVTSIALDVFPRQQTRDEVRKDFQLRRELPDVLHPYGASRRIPIRQ